jgi:hypothetical protein
VDCGEAPRGWSCVVAFRRGPLCNWPRSAVEPLPGWVEGVACCRRCPGSQRKPGYARRVPAVARAPPFGEGRSGLDPVGRGMGCGTWAVKSCPGAGKPASLRCDVSVNVRLRVVARSTSRLASESCAVSFAIFPGRALTAAAGVRGDCVPTGGIVLGQAGPCACDGRVPRGARSLASLCRVRLPCVPGAPVRPACGESLCRSTAAACGAVCSTETGSSELVNLRSGATTR